MSVPPAPVRRGDLIGERYVLGDLLGAGGMGLVYAATQAPLERTVAIKFPRPELAADPAVQREFRREAILASLVEHPNIVRVLEFIAAAPAYLVMEHIVGERLGQLLAARGPLPVRVAADLVSQVLRALHAIHGRGIVHRDVKSDNVLVETTRDGTQRARLFDFGLARFERDIVVCVRDGEVSGTPEYLAPEVIAGAPPRISADIYAAGTILYELIVGETPFAGGSNTDVLSRHVDQPVVPVSWRCPELGIPPELDDVIARALAKEPGERFVNCGVFLQALTAAAAATPQRTPTHRPRAGFHSDAPTSEMTAPRTARDASSGELGCDVDHAVVDYLERARSLVDKHQLVSAISVLEDAARVVGDAEPAWRIELTLAALYEGVGDQSRARSAGVRARERAHSHASEIGCARATRYLAQLAGRLSPRRCRDAR